jgi:hypothetical protein
MSGSQPPPDTVAAVLADYGGEGPFYRAWVRRQVDPLVRRRFRELARNDVRLHADLESVSHPGARTDYRTALELTNYLTTSPPAGQREEDSLTALSLLPEQDAKRRSDALPPSPRGELRRQVREALFQLLSSVDIGLSPTRETHGASALLGYLAGPGAVKRFEELNQWLERMRRRATEPEPPALVRMLRWVASDLFERDGDAYGYRLSFRLFLRDRLRDWCQQEGLRPRGRYQSLGEAFALLDRARIGDLVRSAAEIEEDEPIVAREAVAWLHAAP